MKDTAERFRRAVKSNDLFLVRRLAPRLDIRNIDPTFRRYTSLAWAAALGNEETFEFLLSAGHDDDELSKDSENNTILMILADHKPPNTSPYASESGMLDSGAALRMARSYFDRYSPSHPNILDWANSQGKTAIHHASLKGNEELVRMLCDLGADYDLADNKGNTPLHYASAWGHIPVVQLLIERGCQYTSRNNEGFTASDYAYTFSTRETLQDTARTQFENKKSSRRAIYAQAAARGTEWGGPNGHPPAVPSKARDMHIREANAQRMRSGSGTSRTTATSDSGEHDGHSLAPSQQSQSSLSATSSPSQPSAGSSFFHQHQPNHTPNLSITSSVGGHGSSLAAPSPNPASALSPIASRMRERDADAMDKYLNRTRSGSSSTDNKSIQGSVLSSSSGPSSNGDDSSLTPSSGVSTPRRLRPSVSAAQLRSATPETFIVIPGSSNGSENRLRSGSGPRINHSPLLTRSSSASNSKAGIVSPSQRTIAEQNEDENFHGPPSRFAQFPDPPANGIPENSATPTVSRRMPFHLLSKPSSTLESPTASHRRGMSATSVR